MEKLCGEGRIVQTKPGAVPRYKRYLDEGLGVPIGSIWDDIPPIQSQDEERLGYPTQKPLRLLQRIIELSSSPQRHRARRLLRLRHGPCGGREH